MVGKRRPDDGTRVRGIGIRAAPHAAVGRADDELRRVIRIDCNTLDGATGCIIGRHVRTSEELLADGRGPLGDPAWHATRNIRGDRCWIMDYVVSGVDFAATGNG